MQKFGGVKINEYLCTIIFNYTIMVAQKKENMDYSLEVRLGRRIKAMLCLRGMSQAGLAEKTGMSTQTISLMCNGKADFRLSTLRKIEQALQCTLVLIPNEDLI